jgi:Bacterial Ig domain/RTX calcium-binding nonapeptide repeat (4 copies)
VPVFPTVTVPCRHRIPCLPGALAGAAIALALAVVPAVHAQGWEAAGGTPGRAGSAPIDPGTVPVPALWAKAGLTDGNIVTPPLVSEGTRPAVQRVAYGTANGRVHVQVLASGSPVGPEAGIDVDEGASDSDVFGTLGAGVGLASSGTPSALGQLFALHNDTNQGGGADDIAIAQVDEASGLLVQDVPVPGTDGFSTGGTPVLTAAGSAADSRALFFLATDGVTPRLHRVPISAAGTIGAGLGAPASVAVPGATTDAGLALVYLRTPGNGASELYVALGTSNGVVTYRAADLAPGPASGPIGGAASTPAAPLAAGGLTPGADAGAPASSASMVVAVQAGGATIVRRLVQPDSSPVLSTAGSSSTLAGAPAPGLATSQAATSSGSSGGTVVVGTTSNLYVLDGDSLGVRGAFSPGPLPAGQGFGSAAPAIAGGLVAAVRDDGRQVLAAAADASSVSSGDFMPQAASGGSTRPGGQPAIARGSILFASDRGLFAYETRDATAPTVRLDAPGPRARVAGTAKFTATVYDQRGIGQVEFRLNNKLIGTAKAPASGSEYEPGGAPFTVSYDTRKLPSNKTYYYVVTAQDRSGLTRQSVTRRIVITNPAERRLKPGRCANSLRGSNSDDVLGGSSLGDAIYGRRGDDVLTGVAGDDCLYGSTGADALSGGSGTDLLSGWLGEDLLLGGTGNDTLLGGGSDDVLRGQHGNDRLDGGSGSDKLDGGRGNDRLIGGSGNDRLVGASGVDALYGQGGNDTVDSVDARRETVDCGAGRDAATVDRIDRVRRCERVRYRAPT